MANVNETKPWEHAWTTEEIIENSDKWSLAGDAALLHTLEAFSKNLIEKTTQINNRINNLTNNLNEASLQLDLVQNKFQSLRNTQFIESRVYEDDETISEQTNIPQKENEKKEQDFTEDISEAVSKGLEILDKYFDKVEVSVSDSEDDVDFPNYILRPKDLYFDRPLPYVIGSEEWLKKYHVGLEDSSEESESDKVSENFSESDSESDLKLTFDRSQAKNISETSSEIDFSKKSLGDEQTQDIFVENEETASSLPVHQPIPPANFAQQLAEKLGHVISSEPEITEINRKPLQKKSDNYGKIFFDEPPPLNDNPPPIEKKGLFSGTGGLFDDEDDENESDENNKLWAPKSVPASKQPEKGLFDNDDNSTDDDDIFTSTLNKSKLPPNKPPIFDDEPPPVIENKKKPVGGVSIFGDPSNAFAKNLLRKRQSSDESSEETTKEEKLPKKVSLFDSDDDDKAAEIKNDPIEEKTNNKKAGLFDKDKEEEEEEKPKKPFGGVSILGASSNLLIKQRRKLSSSSEESEKSEEDAIKKKNEETTKNILVSKEEDSKGKVSLFDDKGSEAKKSEPKKISLFDDDDDVNDNIFEDNLFSNSASSKKFTSSLFDDNDNDDDDDLFAGITAASKSTSLFDDVPTPKKNDQIVSEESVATVTSDKLFMSPKEDDLFTPEATKSDNDKPKSNLTSLFDSEDSTNENKEKTEESPSFDNKPLSDILSAKSKITSLFDEPTEDNNDLFTSEKTETPKEALKKVSLFDSSPPSDNEEDDWETKPDPYSDLSDSYSEPAKPLQRSTIFDDEPPSLDISEKIIEDSKSEDNSVKETTKPQPLPRKPPSEEKVVVPEPAITSPKKLKHNLNINVGALLPGVSMPKLRQSESPISPVSQVDKKEDADFDTTDRVEVLQSITKDRARLPSNRKPSTRRGRKAALGESNKEFRITEDEPQDVIKEQVSSESLKKDESSSFKEETPPSASTEKRRPLISDDIFSSNPIKDSADDEAPSLFKDDVITNPTKEDDLFGLSSEKPPSEEVDIFEEHSPAMPKSTIKLETEDLFKDTLTSDFDKDDLFSQKITPSLSTQFIKNEPPPITEVDPVVDIFDDIKTRNYDLFDDKSSDSDDLFGGGGSSSMSASAKLKEKSQMSLPLHKDIFDEDLPPPIHHQSKPQQSSTVIKTKTNIFDDEGSDDDLFTTKKKKPVTNTAKKSKSLFEDDGSDDDIFQTNQSEKQVKTTKVKGKIGGNVSKTAGIRKLDQSKPDGDPLGILK